MAILIKVPSRQRLREMGASHEVIKSFEQLYECVKDLEARLKTAEEKIALEHP